MGQVFGAFDIKVRVPELSSTRRDDDHADRLSHRWTVIALATCAILNLVKTFFGDPIRCWTPAHFDDSHEDYTHDYCWVRNTYYLPVDDEVPAENEPEKRQTLLYYQWIPIILLFQSLLFYMPFAAWKTLVLKSGIDIETIGQAARSFVDVEWTEIRDRRIDFITKQIDRYLRCHQPYTKPPGPGNERVGAKVKRNVAQSTDFMCMCTRRRGNYLVTSYLFVKLLYLANVIAQLFLLDLVLGMSFHAYGIDFIRGVVQLDQDWPNITSARFPRVTMCDLKIRRLGNVHRYSVMCVLPINLFNEKIFLFIWFWLVYVGLATLMSTVAWIVRVANAPDRRCYVKRHLTYTALLAKRRLLSSAKQPPTPAVEKADSLDEVFSDDFDKRQKTQRKKIDDFVFNYLGQDGVFIMRMVAHNSNPVAVTEIIASLWSNYCKKQAKLDDNKTR